MHRNTFHTFQLILFLIFLGVIACEPSNLPPNIWEPDDEGNPTPVVTQVVPADTSIAGIGIVTITGENFSTNPDENLVFFDEYPATTLEASATQLKILAAFNDVYPKFGDDDLFLDSLVIKVSVQGSYLFGDYPSLYVLEYPAVRMGNVTAASSISALTADGDNNIYYAGGGKTIIKVAPDGAVMSLGASPITVLDMKIGPGNKIQFSANKFILQIPSEGGAYEIFGGIDVKINSFDHDPNGNIIIGSQGAIHGLHADASSYTAYENADYYYKSIRVVNDNAYALAKYIGTDSTRAIWGVWRFLITDADGSLGTGVMEFEGDDYLETPSFGFTAITLDSNGGLYLTTDGGHPVIYVPGDGAGGFESSSAVQFYPGVLVSPVSHLSWGGGQYLYLNSLASGDLEPALLRLHMQERRSAPYHGRQ